MRQPILFAVFGLLLFGATMVHATADDEIEFPIAKLGGCESEDACFTYCEEPAHFEACYAFGTEHGLIEEEVDPTVVKAIVSEGGPGGCTSQVGCEAYCSDSSHIAECVSFAEENGLMSDEELAEAKHVAAAIEAGASLPGGCTNKASCDSYCEDPSHMETCLSFAEAAGFMSGDELAEAKKMMTLMKEGAMPGGCTSQESCDAYCGEEDHFEECIDFGVQAGFMTPEEAEEIKTGGKMQAGPGGCEGEDACNTYCEDTSHMQECIEFSVEQGFMTEEEAQELIDQSTQNNLKQDEERMNEDSEDSSGEMMEGFDDSPFEDEPSGERWEETPSDFPQDEFPTEERFPEENFEDIPPQYELSPESLIITPEEPQSLREEPNATFAESVKTFFLNVFVR